MSTQNLGRRVLPPTGESPRVRHVNGLRLFLGPKQKEFRRGRGSDPSSTPPHPPLFQCGRSNATREGPRWLDVGSRRSTRGVYVFFADSEFLPPTGSTIRPRPRPRDEKVGRATTPSDLPGSKFRTVQGKDRHTVTRSRKGSDSESKEWTYYTTRNRSGTLCLSSVVHTTQDRVSPRRQTP